MVCCLNVEIDLRIGLVCRWYPPEDWGGVATYVHALASGLRDYGHDVTVLTSTLDKSLINTEHFENQIRIMRIRRFRFPWFVHRLYMIGRQATSVTQLAYNVRLVPVLRRLVERLKLDIIEYADVNGEGAFHRWVSPLIPYVVRLQSPLFVLEKFYTSFETMSSYKLTALMEKHAIVHASTLISPSRSMAGIIADVCGIKVNQIRVMANPLDPEYLAPLPASREFNFPPNTVLYLGRLEKRKGAFVFAEAIPIVQRAVPDGFFVFAGPDRHSPYGWSSRAEIEKYLFDKEVPADRILFLGQVPRSKLRACYSEPTLVVIPSLYEAYPYSVIEAMSCGASVVASDCYGIPEVINHGVTGLLAKAGDSADLADCVINLLRNPSRRHQLAVAGRKFVREECSPRRIAALTTQVYFETVRDYRSKDRRIQNRVNPIVS